MDKCFEVFKATMVKAFQSSFPPFPNLVKIKVDLDKLNNNDLFLHAMAIYSILIAVD